MPRLFRSLLLCVAAFACIGCAARPSLWAETQLDTTHGFQDALLDRFAGEWTLEGTMAGGEVVHDISAEWVVGHQYLRIIELSREREADGVRSYEAMILIGWNAEREQYSLLWLDSTGGGGLDNGIIGYADPAEDRLVFRYDYDAFRFRTAFIYDPVADAWRWEMDAVRGDGLSPFARVTMTRNRR